MDPLQVFVRQKGVEALSPSSVLAIADEGNEAN